MTPVLKKASVFGILATIWFASPLAFGQENLEREGDVVQMWFRGSHGDVGGQLGDWNAARPLSNIPLAWMLGEAEACGLPLPPHWRSRYLTDPGAPSVGTLRGWSRFFVLRHRRRLGLDRSERVHRTAIPAARALGLPVMSNGWFRSR